MTSSVPIVVRSKYNKIESTMKSKNVLLIIIGLVIMLGLSAWSFSWVPKMTPLTEVQSPGIADEQVGSGALSLTTTPEPTEEEEEGGGETEEGIETEEVIVEETEEARSILGDVIGTVVNGSGGEVPEGLEVTLLVHTQTASEIFTVVEPDGSFIFENVELVPGNLFIAAVEYLGVPYYSSFTEVETGDTNLELSISIYETTTDTSTLVIDWAHILFRFPGPDFVFIIHEYGISNLGDETVASPDLADPTVQFFLPEGAAALDFKEGAVGQPFVKTEEGFGDPRPIIPGEAVYQITYGYKLPFEDNLVWEQPVNIPISMAFILLEGETLSLDSAMFELMGTEDMYEMLWKVYSGGMFSIGDEIRAEITGDNPFVPTGSAATPPKNITPTIILGAVGLVMVGAGVWWWMRSSESVDEAYMDDGSPEAIMDAIIALDADHDAGRIDEVEYLNERASLKARLREALPK